MKNKRAIAYIELLVDLALVAILFGIFIPYYKNMEHFVSRRVARREILVIKNALVSYRDNQNPKRYPPATERICEEHLIAAKPQVVNKILFDPFVKKKNAEYNYSLSPNNEHYCVWSIGSNGRSDIEGIDDEGNVIKKQKCDDVYVTPTFDPV